MDINLEYIKHNGVRVEGSKRGYENLRIFWKHKDNSQRIERIYNFGKYRRW
jgi:hypothetical protein